MFQIYDLIESQKYIERFRDGFGLDRGLDSYFSEMSYGQKKKNILNNKFN